MFTRTTVLLFAAGGLFAGSVAAQSAGTKSETADAGLGMAIMSATVTPYGELESGSGAESAAKSSTGTYTVKFVRSVVGCFHVVSVSRNDTSTSFGIAASSRQTLDDNTIHVNTMYPTATGGDLYDRPFTLLVFCPN